MNDRKDPISQVLATGVTQAAIAEELKVNQSLISLVVSGKEKISFHRCVQVKNVMADKYGVHLSLNAVVDAYGSEKAHSVLDELQQAQIGQLAVA